MKPRLSLFINDPECSIICGAGMYEALCNDYNIQFFTKHNFTANTLKKSDIVAFPGGIGDSDSFDFIFKNKHIDTVSEYVEKGGRYLGICMGAYWASKHYFNLLNGIKAVQYIKRDTSEIKRSYATVAEVKWNDNLENMYFYDGCALIGEKSKKEIIATYANGDAMAIIQNRIGLIGCHPESTFSWYRQSYMNTHWHEFRHHELLLNFVNRLMEK
jgi:glutamine amidotransferase-like uncharacterized protein